MEQRLRELRREYALGQQQLGLLDKRRGELRDTLLRISGAIQVLEEIIDRNGRGEAEPASEFPS